MKITIKYRLSQKGQRDAILKGKDANCEQEETYSVEPTERILSLCGITSDGQGYLDIARITHYIQEDGVKGYDSLLLDIYPDTIEDILSVWEPRLEAQKKYVTLKENEEKEKEEKEKKYRRRLLIIFQEGGIEAVKEELQDYDVYHKITHLNNRTNDLAPIIEILQQEKEEQEAEKKRKKEEKEAEKKKWIAQHGSERLQKAMEEGYAAQKQYVIERATQELKENARIDYDNKGLWTDRSCPSLEAINLEKELKQKGYQAQTVWGYLCCCVQKCYCEKHEMVIVQKYLDICDVVVWEKR